jgi:predicted GNAT superfamily acetyltransferase
LKTVINGKVIEIRRLKDPEEYRMVSDTEIKVWGLLDYSGIVAHHVLIAADRRGGLVLGAFEKDTGKMIGFVFGFPAISPEGKLYHYSHMTGVIPEYRYKGLGYLLKLMQRDYVLKQNIDLIAWTYDPLQSSNAKFNIGKLGIIVRKFYINYYGELRDSINFGMPTDRFEAEWWVKSKLVENKLKGLLKPPSLNILTKLGADMVTKVEFTNNLPVLTSYNLDSNSKLVLIEIPEDLSKLRINNELLNKWRLGLREVFNRYINELKYLVVEFISEYVGILRRNYYVLLKENLEHILSGEFPWR